VSRPSARRWILRAYPRRWRSRYEDEVLAYLDDEFADRSIGVAAAGSLLLGGLTEHCRAQFGAATPGDAGRRGSRGFALVAWGWFLCVLGGIGFSKLSEHFATVPRASGTIATSSMFPVAADVSYVVVVAAALVALLAVAGLSVPALLVAWSVSGPSGRTRLRRTGAWCTVVALAAACALGGLAWWAHRLTSIQRNGSDARYGWAAVVVMVLIAIALGAATRLATVAFSLVRRKHGRLGPATIAWIAVACEAAIALGVAAWWVSVASGAPGFLTDNLSIGLGSGHAIWLFEGLLVSGAALSTSGGYLITTSNRSRRTSAKA